MKVTHTRFPSNLLRVMHHHTYKEALSELNSAINRVFINKTATPQELYRERFQQFWPFLNAVGLTNSHLENLHIVHVAGSKGKGSTCAIVEAVLRNLGFRTGFLSSPHLVNVEERIRINGRSISQEHFAQLFWDVHDSVDQVASSEGLPRPSYLQYLILMAFRAFVLEKVEAAVVEVGLGGRYDHTNFFNNPCVTAVTNLSLEHTEILGNTIEEIAWKKAGIFKAGCPAVVSTGQTNEAMRVFQTEAERVGCPLFVCPQFGDLCTDNAQLEAYVSKTFQSCGFPASTNNVRMRNMVHALSIVHLWLKRTKGVEFSTGLQPELRFQLDVNQVESALRARWPGRWQMIVRKDVTYFLDGAHTDESVQTAAEWFQSASSQSVSKSHCLLTRVLIFTVLGPRDPEPMLKALKTAVKPGFDLVLFANPHGKELVVLPSKKSMDAFCLNVWNNLCAQERSDKPPVPAYRIPTFSQFVDWISSVPRRTVNFLESYPFATEPDKVTTSNSISLQVPIHCHVLVTGSLYLVGAALKALNEPVQ